MLYHRDKEVSFYKLIITNKMKKLTLLTLIVALFTITGCKKDKEKGKENPNAIVGKWIATSIWEISYENGKEVARDDDSQENLLIEFKSDGTGTSQTEGESATFTYTIKDGILSYKIEDEVDQYKIISLTNSELELHHEESETIEGVVYKDVLQIKLKKR